MPNKKHSFADSTRTRTTTDGAMAVELIVQTPKAELPPCTLRCRIKQHLKSEFTTLDYFAVIDGFYSALVLGKGNGEFHVGFRPGDWDAVERTYKPGQTISADMFPMGREIDVVSQGTLKEDNLQSHFYPKLSSLQSKLTSLDLEQNGKVDLACFTSVVKSSCPSFTVEEITEIFETIDEHDTGFIYFEDITDMIDTPRLAPCLQNFLRALEIKPIMSTTYGEEDDAIEMDLDELRNFVSHVVHGTTENLTQQLSNNNHALRQVKQFQINSHDDIRRMIAEELQRQQALQQMETNTCKCVIS